MKRSLATAMCLLLAACGSEPAPLQLGTPDRARFDQEVYPVLLRDCGFNACHGSSERFFQVFGPGRARLPTVMDALADAAPEELAYSYDRARSMIDASAPDRSLLLRKPLATAAGGSGHEGADRLGRNVYQTKLEAGYVTLAAWVLAQPAPAATPAGPTPAPATTTP
jgi:hypothetical protein